MERNGERMIIIALCQKKQEIPMKVMVLCGVMATLLMMGADGADAKGCIKGAIVGGIAGHYAGHHGLAGATAGCVIGHHEAKRRERERTNSEDLPPR
jgi:hypothetical protein